MTPLALQNFASVGAGAIVDSLVLGFLVGAIAWALLALLRKHRAAIRFLVVAAALLCVAVLPALRTVLGGRSVSTAAPLVHLDEGFALAVALTWAVGASLGLLRVGLGIISLRRVRNRCRPLSLSPELRETLREFCPSRTVEVLAGDTVSVPSAIGFFRPAVILPPWLLEELSPAEVRQILIHELSHLRRRDDWTNLLQRIVKAVFFFHPAVWWMESRLSLEREMACDDAVLAESPSARDYAECLTRVAEKTLVRRGLALAQAAVSRMRDTTRRVARILQLDRAAGGGKFAISVATVFAIAGFGALLQAPTLVSFSTAAASPAFQPVLAKRAAAPHAVNATLNSRSLPHAINAGLSRAHESPQTEAAPAAHSLNAIWHSTLSHSASPAIQAKQSRPTVRAVQARMTTDTLRGATFVFVTQDQDSITVWRITTWQYVPSVQVRADRKTT